MESRQTAGRKVPVDMDAVVGTLLGAGVLTSVLFLVAGLAWHWVRTGRLGIDYALPHENVVRFVVGQVRGVIREGWGPVKLVNLGIITLLLTPYLRVLLSVIYFAFVARNYKYAAITGFVCSVLTYTLFLR